MRGAGAAVATFWRGARAARGAERGSGVARRRGGEERRTGGADRVGPPVSGWEKEGASWVRVGRV